MPDRKYRVHSKLVEIDVDAISIPSWARQVERDYLEESLDERGQIVPIVVGRTPDKKFILIDGMGRLTLAKKRGDKTILARIVDIQDEKEALLLAIELEYTKKEWSLEYTFRIIQELEEKGYTRKQIAEILKIPRSKLYRIITIMELPDELEEVKQLFLQGYLPLRAADVLREALNILGAKKIKNILKQTQNIDTDPQMMASRFISKLKDKIENIKWARNIENWAKELEQQYPTLKIKVESGGYANVHLGTRYLGWITPEEIKSKEDLEKWLKDALEEEESEEEEPEEEEEEEEVLLDIDDERIQKYITEENEHIFEFAREIIKEAKSEFPEFEFKFNVQDYSIVIIDPNNNNDIAEIDIYDRFNDKLRHKGEVLDEIRDEIQWYEPEEKEEERQEEESEEIEEIEEVEVPEEEKPSVPAETRESEMPSLIDTYSSRIYIMIINEIEKMEPLLQKEIINDLIKRLKQYVEYTLGL